MAKYPHISITNTGYWCDPRVCGHCKENYDCCQCNQDNATYDFCEDCVNAGLAPDWKGIIKKREPYLAEVFKRIKEKRDAT